MKKLHIIHNGAKNVEKIHKKVYNKFRIVVIDMKKIIKMISIALIVLTMTMFIQIIANNVYADDIIDTNEYEDPSDNSINDIYEVMDRASTYVMIIRNIGIIVSVIALMLIGIRAMVGSAEEKADYQKSLPGYLIGVVLVFAMSMIPTIIYKALQ